MSTRIIRHPSGLSCQTEPGLESPGSVRGSQRSSTATSIEITDAPIAMRPQLVMHARQLCGRRAELLEVPA